MICAVIDVMCLQEVQDVIISGCGRDTHNLWAANIASLPILNRLAVLVQVQFFIT